MDTSLSPPQQSPNVTELGQLKIEKESQPPPIIIDGIANFIALHEFIAKIRSGFQIKVINDKNIKINVEDGKGYQVPTKTLTENKYSWYSNENNQNRPIKVMSVKLHHSSNPKEITQKMRKRGFK